MDKKEFDDLKNRLNEFKYSSLEHVPFDKVKNYKLTLSGKKDRFIAGYNEDFQVQELHFAVNNIEAVIEKAKEFKEILVTMVPYKYKARLLEEGFSVYGELQDYWMKDLSAISADISDICFIEQREYEEASYVTMSVKDQSREFHGESPLWIEEWVTGKEPGAKESGCEECNIIVHRVCGRICGIVCVAVYGYNKDNEAVVWIREIAVLPEFQGKGIGRKLLNQALKYGVSKKAQKAFLMADNCNINAIELYKSIGFTAKEDEIQLDMMYRQ